VIQEGLTNAFRHAQSAQQRVDLALSGDRIMLRVSDAGPGFEPPLPGEWGEHMGLAGMRDRVESLGGEFGILSQPGGTVLLALIPLHVSQEGP
jgi:signal transduction histidine kinase